MTPNTSFHLYSGTGVPVEDRGLWLPSFEKFSQLDDPRFYLAERGLRDAVNVAIALGQPLLVTGEPGTGKTQLAGSIAYELGLPEPFVFYTKTTTTAKDLFYRYDAMAHFHDVQFKREVLEPESYITYEPLGLAILLSLDPAEAGPHLPEHLRDKGPVRSVVLIDEIDKAPRDLPNDVLNEIENMSFAVRETGQTFSADQRFRPILLLTSNSERNLPDAFLRRCVFYHISFPDRVQLREIVERRLDLDSSFTPQMLESAIEQFEMIRDLSLKKKPATAEFLAWVRILEKMQLDVNNLEAGQKEVLAFTYSILAKTKEDKSILERTLLESTEL